MCSKQATRPSITKAQISLFLEREIYVWLHSLHRTFTTFQYEPYSTTHTYTPSCLTKLMSRGQKHVTCIPCIGLEADGKLQIAAPWSTSLHFQAKGRLLGPLMRPLQPCPAGVCMGGVRRGGGSAAPSAREGPAGLRDLGSAWNQALASQPRGEGDRNSRSIHLLLLTS